MAHDPYEALRVPGYGRLLGGNLGSALGLEAMTAAVSWEVHQRTGSSFALGMVGFVQFLPVLLLALPAGVAADRFSRKWQFVIAQSVAATASIALAAISMSQLSVTWIFVVLTVVGVARAFTAPARSALLPQVVPREALTNAVAWNSGGWQVASTLGPLVGAWVIARSGRCVEAYLAAAACSAMGALLVATVQPRPMEPAYGAHDFRSLATGVRFVWNTRLILATITLDLFAVLLGGATALLPVYATEILKTDAAGFGWLRAAPSLGAIVMALLLAHQPPLKRAGRTLLLSVAGFGVATIAFGLSRNFWLSLTALAVAGALDNISIVVRSTLVQQLTPESMRGRVSAVTTIFIVSSNELGMFESGVVASLIGPVLAVVTGGIGTLAVVAIIARRFPELRKLGSLGGHEPAAQPEKLPLGATDMSADPEG